MSQLTKLTNLRVCKQSSERETQFVDVLANKVGRKEVCKGERYAFPRFPSSRLMLAVSLELAGMQVLTASTLLSHTQPHTLGTERVVPSSWRRPHWRWCQFIKHQRKRCQMYCHRGHRERTSTSRHVVARNGGAQLCVKASVLTFHLESEGQYICRHPSRPKLLVSCEREQNLGFLNTIEWHPWSGESCLGMSMSDHKTLLSYMQTSDGKGCDNCVEMVR